jgi:protein SCO1/2
MRSLLTLSTALLALGLAASPAAAGDPDHVARVRESVAFDQKLGADLDLTLTFLDEEGRTVRLADYFGKKAVLLTPVYYGCPQLCTQVLNGLVAGMGEMSLEIGRDFEVVTFSIDPLETPEDARAKKAAYLELLGKPAAATAWHFLVADPTRNTPPVIAEGSDRAHHNSAIDALTSKLGFRYGYDHEIDEYAHAAGIVVCTPEGKTSKYLYGIEFLPRDLRLSIVDSSNGKVGSLADQLFLWICYHYDPLSGKYSFAIMGVLRALGVLTVIGIAAYLVVNLRRERALARLQAGG